MARRPRNLPRWYHAIYGGHEDAWEEAKVQCERALRSRAARRDLCTYGDLASSVDAIAWPDGPHTHEGSQMGYLLGQVSLDQLDLATDRPLISALVVEKDSQRPSHGFWAMCRELGLAEAVSTVSRREEFWLREIERCWKSYGAGQADVK